MKRGLIAYYSRTGYTASLATEVAGMTGWDCVEIKDLHPRDGAWGQLRCVLDVLLHRRPRIEFQDRPMDHYETVILAAPVWLQSLASPMRTFIAKHRGHFPAVAYLCTYGGRGAEKAARQAAEMAGAPLVAMLAVTSHELEQGDYRWRLDEFLKKLHAFRIGP
ncbi:MAG TPA: flavodoxin [Gammaproteobacteria bacterium]|nr:flavodoxin [Gammaproteobacteria bacterium]